MGALTGTRKRCSADLRAPFSPSSALSIFLSRHTPPEVRTSTVLCFTGGGPQLRRCLRRNRFWINRGPRAFPPLRRAVHGPQKIVRVFGRGSGVGVRRRFTVGGKEGDVVMGNVVSWFLGRASFHSRGGLRRRGEASVVRSGDHGFRVGDLEGLRLADDKRPVDDYQGVPSAAAAEQRSRGMASGDTIFTVTTREEDELLEDVGKSPLEGDTVVASRSPAYKDLWLRAKKRDSRLSSLDFKVKLNEKRISKFSKVSEVKPGEDLLAPFTPLTDEEENAVNLALWDTDKLRLHKDEVLVLHESSNIEITRDAIQCLRQRSWLNDEVINLYFELLKEREKREPKKFLKCHFFNTFFYKKLTRGKNGYDFKAVRRWTTLRKLGYGLIECDKIFIPIHKGKHWCLAVLDVRNEKLHYLDSLGGLDEHALKVLACYYVDEVKDKYNKTVDITSWKYEAVDNLPRQKNGWDCGMFVLKYADFISRGLSLCFQQEENSQGDTKAEGRVNYQLQAWSCLFSSFLLLRQLGK